MFTLLFIAAGVFKAAKFESRDAAYDWAFGQDEQITLVKLTKWTTPSCNPASPQLSGYHFLDDYGYRGTMAMTPMAVADHLKRNPTHQLAPMPV